jgi:hypothetical protein
MIFLPDFEMEYLHKNISKSILAIKKKLNCHRMMLKLC